MLMVAATIGLAGTAMGPRRAAIAVEGDVVFKRQGEEGGTPRAVFAHWSHRIRYKCYACHPALFEMKAGRAAITMDAIQEGKFCGACHDGKRAWAVTFETCNACHPPRGDPARRS
jgi:c(7)-type cytochrome triheme protein